MLLSSGLSKDFWGEAMSTAAFLINRCPSSAIDFEIPEERWTGRSVHYEYLRVFGCAAYAHIKQDKLDARALRCVMLGYPKGTKGYRLWCIEPEHEKILISRDVRFDESKMPFLKKESSTQGGASSSVPFEVENESRKSSDSISDQDSSDDNDAENEEGNDDLSSYQLARDRTKRRFTQKPVRYRDDSLIAYALTVAQKTEYNEPKTYDQAMKSIDKDKWIQAMQEELDSLIKNMTWVLVDRPAKQKAVGCKWIFKRKIEVVDGVETIRFKARLVAKGYTQKEGVDYNEIFSPVVKHCSIRLLLSIVAQDDLELEQLDVKTAFLHGELKETIYMEQPEGFIVPGCEGKVCLLKKSLYGLKQSSRQWYLRFDKHMEKIGYTRSLYDNCVYLKNAGKSTVSYLLLYVDDMLIASKSKREMELLKSDLESTFEMKRLGEAKRILGIDICRDRRNGKLWLMQENYINKIVNKFNMNLAKSVVMPMPQNCKLSESQKPKNEEEMAEMEKIPYANAVGSIMYAMICTRPDLAHSMSVLSRFMANPGREHWEALKWVFRYLKGTAKHGILYEAIKDKHGDAVEGFVDSDYAANVDSRRSQLGFVFCLNGSAVSWRSSLQSVVALSTTEAEYMAMTEAIKESIWLRGIIKEFGIKQKSVTVHCDSQSALHLIKHQVYHERSKHIDVKYHFVRDIIDKGLVKVVKIGTEEHPADMLTKALPTAKFRYCLRLIGLLSC